MNLHLLVLSAFMTIGLSTAEGDHWGYPNLEVEEEFPSWGGLCDKGKRQSPIDLTLKGALKGEFDKLEFKKYDNKQKDVAMVNNGHSIQLSEFAYEMELKGGPLTEDYVVEQIHLHWWSEHTIDSIRYPLEAHIVHRNKKYPNITMAAGFKDGITVIGVLYHVSNQQNDAIKVILDNIDEVKSYKQLNKPIRMKEAFTVRDLFPDIDGYMTYAGSLTTPTCAESVTWIVLRETFPVTLQQVDQLKEVEFDEGKQLKNNYRSIQSSNNRAVVVVLSDNNGRGGASSTTVRMSLGTILLVALFAKYLQ